MIRPCDVEPVICLPCAEENPLANLSSEDPDQDRFLALYYFEGTPGGNGPWRTAVCATFCESATSQQDADDCAKRLAQECVWSPPNDPDPPTIFSNPETTCLNGDGCFYTLPAGSVIGLSQADADAVAQSLCDNRVNDSSLVTCGSSPPPPPPDSPCPTETGTAAPDSLELTEELNWGEVVINDPQTLRNTPWPPATSDSGRQDLGYDFPPGDYEVQYERGVWRYTDFVSMPGEFDYLSGISTMSDEEQNTNIPNDPLADTNTVIEGEFTGVTSDDYFEFIEDTVEEAVSNAQNYWLDPDTRWLGLASHSNTDQVAFFTFENGILADSIDWGPLINTPAHPQVFSIYQTAGGIPQPRKLVIEDYSTVSAQFMDQSAALAWNGQFPTRTTYTSMVLRWDAAAAGAFGGADIQYIMDHPTSASGKGWAMNIFSAGMVLLWRGLKAVGDTGIGRYYKDNTTTPIGPACITCLDDSDRPWEPL